MVYAKKPFGGPAQVLAYLGRYTHRVAIANSRLVGLDETHVAFTWKDYRAAGTTKIMRPNAEEFIRRFLLHVLPDGFHRIRSFGFMANGHRTTNLARCREMMSGPGEDARAQDPSRSASDTAGKAPFVPACPHCGGVMHIVGSVPRSFHQSRPRAPPFTGVAT